MDLPLLMELRKIKEEQLENEAKKMEKKLNDANKNNNNSKVITNNKVKKK